MHNVRKPDEGNKVVTLFFQFFSCSLVDVYLSIFFGSIGESIEIVGEDGIDLYINALNLC